MSERDTSGPAFPVPSYVNADGETFESKPQGLTKREWFAGMAMNAFGKDVKHWKDPLAARTISERAYAWADAMIAAGR